MELLTKIKNLCKIQDISLAELERRTGIGNGIIVRWDKSKPSAENLKKDNKKRATYLKVALLSFISLLFY